MLGLKLNHVNERKEPLVDSGDLFLMDMCTGTRVTIWLSHYQQDTADLKYTSANPQNKREQPVARIVFGDTLHILFETKEKNLHILCQNCS